MKWQDAGVCPTAFLPFSGCPEPVGGNAGRQEGFCQNFSAFMRFRISRLQKKVEDGKKKRNFREKHKLLFVSNMLPDELMFRCLLPTEIVRRMMLCPEFPPSPNRLACTFETLFGSFCVSRTFAQMFQPAIGRPASDDSSSRNG
ncbi:MAG: hypothetical protein MR681_07730 [Prevotella sp.]|nr:hypothetical protein [Prevotella sp.]